MEKAETTETTETTEMPMPEATKLAILKAVIKQGATAEVIGKVASALFPNAKK
jgi:hypothetical protein